jgi:hypothetical protein
VSIPSIPVRRRIEGLQCTADQRSPTLLYLERKMSAAVPLKRLECGRKDQMIARIAGLNFLKVPANL